MKDFCCNLGTPMRRCFNTFYLLLTFLLSNQTLFCNGVDVINTTQTIKDSENQTLISSGGAFELGFFSPGNSRYRYLAIWYRNKITVRTVVWVANRDDPITNASGTVLKLLHSGILVLLNSTNCTVWSTNSSRVVQSPIAQLLDTGNLVVKEANDENPDNYLWQSFENPTDTLLAGMKLGRLPSGHENFLSSWKSSDDPGTGPYTYHIDPTGYPQAVLRKGSLEQYRTGPWNGAGYSGLPGLKRSPFYSFDYFMNGSTVYYYYEVQNSSVVSRFMLSHSGIAQRWLWIDPNQGWKLCLKAPTDCCDPYNQCGAHGSCDPLNFPMCGCLKKFIPKFPEAWGRADWKDGCVRRTPLFCETDGFVKYPQVKLPDTRNLSYNISMPLSECREVCRRDCSCMAYSSLDVRNGGSGCLFWFGELIDIKQVTGAGQHIFIRMASSELDRTSNKADILIASLTSAAGLIIVVGGFVMCLCKKKYYYYLKLTKGVAVAVWHKEQNKDLELPLFDLQKITKATNAFSPQNILGEGGFGPVFKGTLENGQDIAVKRLSKTSFQGLDELKNEVVCIARLQHRNLVKLMGCCMQGKENLLIYEYMPNGSLDLILFDEEKSKLLDWPRRFHIITGIARGLMYLHQDSRLRIIHRDLKVSNILLDIDMNPKISDFGIAKIFEGNQIEASTNKIVGTQGYMAPEYTSSGLFSTKSDVFSFGVIVLEILSGQRNRTFSYRNGHQNLLGHAWILHRDGKGWELVQKSIMESCLMSEVVRSINVGLLCVQGNPEDRPTMSSVVNMFENIEDAGLARPRLPGFFVEEGDGSANDVSISTKASSRNEISSTMPEPR